MPAYTLAELAEISGAEVSGDASLRIEGLATLQNARASQLSFLSNPKYEKHLQSTQAGAVILAPAMLQHCPVAALVHPDPYLVYARLSRLWERVPNAAGRQIHATAVIDPSVTLGENVLIEAGVVVHADARIGDGVVLGANTVVGFATSIGDNTRLFANVSVYHDVHIGRNCIVHSGVVIGSDGFGFAPHRGAWVKIAQLGGVIIEDEVEIGANSTIDRGALDPTLIGKGVKLDNQVQIAHNVVVGDHTVMAAGCAVAGSTQIGKHCVLAGKVGVAGHLTIVDHCHVTAMSMVIKNLTEPGVYSSGTGIQPNAQWRKTIGRLRQLDRYAARLKDIEKTLRLHEQENAREQDKQNEND